MRKLCSIVLVLGSTCLSAGPARSEIDAATFLKNYDSGDKNARQMYRAFLLGVASGLGWAETYSVEVRKQPRMQCRPPGTVHTGEQLLDFLRKEVADHEKSGQALTGLALFAALRRAYPCSSGS